MIREHVAGGTRRIGWLGVGLLSALLLTIAAIGDAREFASPAAAQAPGTLRIDPATKTVGVGATFDVNIIQHADVATIGAGTNFSFDARILQIVGITLGQPYQGASFYFGDAEQGTSSDIGTAVVAANSSGVLPSLTAFYLPGAGQVPPGDAIFLTLKLKAKAAGQSALKMEPIGTYQQPGYHPIEMLDSESHDMTVETTGGSVTVSGSAPVETAQTTVTPTAGTPKPTGTRVSGVQGVTGTAAIVSVVPASAKVAVGATTTVDLRVKLPVDATSAQASLSFKKGVIELVSVEPAGAWKQGKLVIGSGQQTAQQAIADANQSGVLKSAGVLFSPGTVPAGEDTLLKLTMRGLKDGESSLKLSDVEVVDASGNTIKVQPQNAKLVVGSGAGGGGLPVLWIVLAAVVALVAGGGGAAYWLRRRSQA